MNAAGRLSALLNVRREVGFLEGAFARTPPRCVVDIEKPTGFGVEEVRHFVEREQAFPVGGGVGTVNGLGEIELCVAAGNEVAVPVGDVAVGVGKDGVVGGVSEQLHGLFVFGVVVGLGTQVALLESGDGRVHQLDGDQVQAFFADNWSTVIGQSQELSLFHSLRRDVGESYALLNKLTLI